MSTILFLRMLAEYFRPCCPGGRLHRPFNEGHMAPVRSRTARAAIGLQREGIGGAKSTRSSLTLGQPRVPYEDHLS